MQSGSYEYQSEIARKYFEGIQQARQEGRQEGRQGAVLTVLASRGLLVDEAARQRVQACTDPEQLDRWLRKALTVSSAQQLFE